MANTAPTKKEIETQAIAEEEDDDETLYKVRVITKTTNRNKVIRLCVIGIIMLVISVIATLLLLAYFGSFSTNTAAETSPGLVTDNMDIQNYLLPNTTVGVSTNTNSSIAGQFVVDDIDYEFESVAEETVQFVSFINVNGGGNNWLGFKLDHLNDSRLVLEMYHSKSGIHVIEFKKAALNKEDTILLDAFLENLLCEHYIELSIKLGGLGYIGSDSHAIEDLHRFAQWIWKYETDGATFKNDKWVDITEEVEKVNAIVSASRNAGFQVSNLNQVITYTSNEYSATNSRSLLGNCPFIYCGNDCFGMCGPGCSCWSWACGDCLCWAGCVQHDYYCSCIGMTHSCCVDVFWVKCDGSGSCW